MTLPNFLVLGVSKGGTTWIFHMLRQHQQVFMSGERDIPAAANLEPAPVSAPSTVARASTASVKPCSLADGDVSRRPGARP